MSQTLDEEKYMKDISIFDVLSCYIKLFDQGGGIYTGKLEDRWDDTHSVRVDTKQNRAWSDGQEMGLGDLEEMIDFYEQGKSIFPGPYKSIAYERLEAITGHNPNDYWVEDK